MINLNHTAEEMAFKAHEGQVDKQGQPYITHPWRVAMQGLTEGEIQVGWLHDVLEDSELYTYEDLALIFGVTVADAVNAMTRPKGRNYMDYIQSLCSNPLAMVVKLRDLRDNMRTDRGPIPESLMARYRRAHRHITFQLVITRR